MVTRVRVRYGDRFDLDNHNTAFTSHVNRARNTPIIICLSSHPIISRSSLIAHHRSLIGHHITHLSNTSHRVRRIPANARIRGRRRTSRVDARHDRSRRLIVVLIQKLHQPWRERLVRLRLLYIYREGDRTHRLGREGRRRDPADEFVHLRARRRRTNSEIVVLRLRRYAKRSSGGTLFSRQNNTAINIRPE